MRIVNLSPDSAIGASSWFLELEGHRLLMGAGTHPQRKGRDSLSLGGTVLSTKDDISGDELGLGTARNTGLRVADFALKLAGAKREA